MNEILGWFLTTVSDIDPVLRTLFAGFAILLETSVLIGLIIPGDSVVLVAATGVSGTVEFILLIVAVVIGALIGESVGYFVGKTFGPAIQHSRLGRLVGHKNWVAAERFLDHRGGVAVFVSRFLPVLHSVVPLTAGVIGMHYRRFIAWTAPACIIWATLYVTVGHSVAMSFEALNQSLHYAGYIFVGVIVLFIVVMTLVKKALHKYAHGPHDPKSDGS